MKKKNMSNQTKQLSLMDLIEQNENVQKIIKFLIQSFDVQDLRVVSRDTILEKILKIFDEGSDIPLELPFIAFITAWSAFLNEKEVYTKFGSDVVYPDIWNIVLADSGSGKSYTIKKLKEILKTKPITAIGTSASFIKKLAEETTGKGFIIKDEFAEFLKQMENAPYMQEIKEYLLQMYCNEKIERITKKESYVVDKPIFSLLGTTVKDAFISNIKPIWIVDGFLQRFCYLIAKRDPQKHILNYLAYYIDLTPLQDEIETLKKHIQLSYNLDMKVFRDACSTYFNETLLFDFDNSFARRYLFRVVKYSLIFHTLLKTSDPNICIEAIMRSCVLIKRHIVDIKNILNEMGMSELERKFRQVERLIEKLGRLPKPREVVIYVKGIKTVQEAKAMLSLFDSEPKTVDQL